MAICNFTGGIDTISGVIGGIIFSTSKTTAHLMNPHYFWGNGWNQKVAGENVMKQLGIPTKGEFFRKGWSYEKNCYGSHWVPPTYEFVATP